MSTRLKEQCMRLLTLPAFNAIASSLLPRSLPVFTLHRSAIANHPVSGIEPEYLRRCLRYLKSRGYYFARADEVIAAIKGEKNLPARSVSFCLDDGYLDQAQALCKVFIEEQCPATLFVIADLVDGIDWPWDDKIAYMIYHTKKQSLTVTIAANGLKLVLNTDQNRRQSRHKVIDACKRLNSKQLNQAMTTLATALEITPPAQPPAQFQPISWDDARQLSTQGIAIGPHTCSHRILSQLDDQQSEQEITQSWQRVLQQLPNASKIFCYPTGRKQDFGEREQLLLQKHGFDGGFSSIAKPVILGRDNNEFAISRMHLPKKFSSFIRYSSWLEVLREKLSR